MEPFKITAHLGIAGDHYREVVTVTAEWSGRRLSIVGNRGQNIESTTDARPYRHDTRTDTDRARIRAIWERWHLNDLRPGCEHQHRGFRAMPGLQPAAEHYRSVGTCRVCGYRYGSAWNYEPVPDDVLSEIRHLLDDDAHRRPLTDDGRATFYSGDPEDDDPDEDEPENFPHADTVSAAEIIGRTYGPEVDAEIDEAQGYASAGWNWATLIAVDYFPDYARDFAHDIGAVKNDAEWPGRHIDWSAAADDLAQDYTEVTIDGRRYYVR